MMDSDSDGSNDSRVAASGGQAMCGRRKSFRLPDSDESDND